MTQTELDQVIQKLTGFSSKLITYRGIVVEYLGAPFFLKSGLEAPLRQWTQAVAREAGGAKPMVQAILGVRNLTLDNQAFDPWLEAFSGSYIRPMLLHSLDSVIQSVDETIGYLQSRHLIDLIARPVQPQNIQRPRIFIAHDGPSELRNTLEVECWRMMLEPVVAEEQVSLNESVDTKVGRLLDGCQFAIVLARLERGLKQDSHTIPRANIIDEIGRIRTKLGDTFVILLERGLSLPTNQATGVVYETFDQANFDGAILKVIKSLRAHSLL